MQTMTDLSTFNLEISEQKSIPSATGLIKRFKRITQRVGYSKRLLKIEKWTNRFCMVIVAVSALYFTPIVISILFR
jgi:hypothetical protein